jgi:hypothetical protein
LERLAVLGLRKGKAIMDTKNISQATKLCDGLLAIMGKSAKVEILGKEVKISVLKDTLAVIETAHAEMIAARAAYISAAAKHRALVDDASVATIVPLLAAQLRTRLTAAQLETCGIAPTKKRRALTDEERTLANAKRRLTRAAKGLLSPKQRRARDAREGLAAVYGTEPASPPETAPPDGTPANATR